MNAPETLKPAAGPINLAHEVLLKADEALCVEEVARAILDGFNPTKAYIKHTAKLLKQLADLGMIEMEPRAGGVPFYRLIAAPASEISDVAEVGDMNAVELGDSEGGEADAPAIAPAIMATIAEDARNAPAADADGWIPWVATADSQCPVDPETRVRVRLENEDALENFAKCYAWNNDGLCIIPIIAYKIIAQAPVDFATAPELQYLAAEDYEMPPADPALLASANRALGEQLEAVKAELEIERGRLAACGVVAMCDTPESAKKARDMREEYRSASCDDVARRVDECMALRTERDDLRARLDAVTQQSIADTDALTQQIEHLRAEIATERQAREALQEQAGDEAVDVKDAAVGYLVRVPKRAPLLRRKPESARAAALSAVRAGAAHAEVLAVVPVGTARRGAEWRVA